MRSHLDDQNDAAPFVGSPSPMVRLGNPARMLPTNAITDLATTGMQPVPSNPASPLQFAPMTPLAVVNPNAYRSGLDVDQGRFTNGNPEDLTEIDYQRATYEPGMRGLGEAAPGIDKKLIILGILGVAAAWYFSQKKGRHA